MSYNTKTVPITLAGSGFCEFSCKQAEVGQSPTLLAVCAANGVLGILRGYPYHLTASRKSFLVYPKVSRNDFYRYINKS